jgi:hypothetical protein
VKRIVAIIAIVVVVLFVIGFLAITPLVNARVKEAADKRALEIAHQGVSYRFTHVELRDVTITAKGSKRVTVRAPTMDARLHGMQPSWVIIPRAEIAVNGAVDDVMKTMRVVRDADAKLLVDERLPIDVNDGIFKWKEPLGAGSAISFAKLTATVRPKESLLKASLKNGKVELPQVSFGGLSLDVSRSVAKGETIDLRAAIAGDDGHAVLEAHRHDGATNADVTVEAFSLAAASAKGLDLTSAIADGSAHGERDEDGAIKSNGKLSVTKLKLPPIKVGPVSLVIGGKVSLTWKGSPKKGAPGVMNLDDAKVEATLGGKTRVVKVRGEIAIGETGEGPYTVKLEWEAGPFACAEIVADVGGALAKGLVAGAVSGNVQARGTIRGDLSDIDAMKHSIEILEGCKVDVGKGLGGLMNGLPF